MYLKSIEVQGFKSFANRIKFEFHNGITAIVGPNGSGKSNVADAVRWVLGEQSIKQLRGASMQDVIFSGTEMRKPLGFAYVAICFDNSDHKLASNFDEVTVARKLYRSGESEYLLNGAVARLKDVRELFYDTGVGKEGYSIIGQGQIDKILSGKPEERRELFDEAAGIVKFKKRKAVSQKNLEDEKQNLIRVNDILAELERQIGPLLKQSDKAKEYLKQKEELKRYDVNYFLLENQKSSKELDDVVSRLDIAKADFEKTNDEFSKIKEEYAGLDKLNQSLEKDIEETRNSLSNTSNTRTKLEGEIKVLDAEILSAKNNVNHFQSRLNELMESISVKNKERQNILEKKSKVDELIYNMDKDKEEVQTKLDLIRTDIEKLSDSIENDKNKLVETFELRAGIKSEKARYETMLENVGVRKANLTSKFLQAKSNEQEQQIIIQSLEDEFEKITQEINDLDFKQKKKEERRDEIHDELSSLDESLRTSQSRHDKDKTKLEQLSNFTERYDGFGKSVTKVMERKSDEKGIIGVVADIIKVDKKYEVAIETALGGNIQNIVTEDEDVAKKMITYLKNNKYGRATFLPLTSIKNPQEFKTPEVLNEYGVIGMANEIVNTEHRYKDVAKSMLGRIVVVDNMDNALKIARKYNYGIRMVTIDGELLVPGGAISGGTFKNSSNLLSRRREMDELELSVKNSLVQINDILEKIENVKAERNSLRNEIEEIKIGIQEAFLRQNAARINVTNAQERIKENSVSVDALKNEENEIEKLVLDIKEKQSEIEEKLKESFKIEEDINYKVNISLANLEKLRDEESKFQILVNEKDIELQKVLQQQGFEKQNAERIEIELEKLISDRDEVKNTLDNNDEDILRKKEDIDKIKKTIEASYSFESDSEKHLKEIIGKKEQNAEKQKSFFTIREQLSDKITDLDKELYRLNSQKDKLSESIAYLSSYMFEEYELSLVDAKELKDESLNDLVVIKRTIAELKDKIKRLGDVNVNAIEEYKEVSERYNLLKKQHDDLVEAEKVLVGIIDELDDAMRKQFAEKFEEIKHEFDKVFKEMFGGGKGTLELMDDSDILEAGIKIIAQPPGKKLQNMMQLSGGEKSLAAIALLFAIQNLKPSPFCLLDEIEAALDESNVGRFAGYLHKLTKYTQFIVITHRRGTMEKADRLYGITMQEKGVSTLVSVNLIDKDLDN